jgi:hypothetical protein
MTNLKCYKTDIWQVVINNNWNQNRKNRINQLNLKPNRNLDHFFFNIGTLTLLKVFNKSPLYIKT